MIRPDGDYPPVGGRSLIEPSQLLLGNGQVVQCVRGISPESQCFLVGQGRLLQPPQPLQGIAEIVVEGRHPVILRDRLADQIHRDVVTPTLDAEHAEQVQCIRMLRIRLQNLPIKMLRLFELSGPMAMRGNLEHLVDTLG